MPDTMYNLIAGFPDQLAAAIEMERPQIIPPSQGYSNVVICGLGGSGIGGKVVADILEEELRVPLIVHNNYGLPSFSGDKTLVIICSYSGNTEETLSSLNEALSRKCAIYCVCSGGEASAIASEHNLPLLLIPGGNPPRSQFGWSATQLFFILRAAGIVENDHKEELLSAVELLRTETDSIKNLASMIAGKISRRIPIIYCSSGYEGVAVRWRQQFNENSKTLCWHHVVPEMNHNELVGWAGADNTYAALLLRSADVFVKSKIRLDISSQIFSTHSDMVLEFAARGQSKLERSFYLIHLGDWLSWYLAKEKDVDPMVIDEIDLLKSELSKSVSLISQL